MRIGAVSGYGSMMDVASNYRINSIYGNPKSLEAVERIGEDKYKGNPLAVVSNKDDEDTKRIKEQQDKPFDFEAAMQRAGQGMTTQAAGSQISFNLGDEMTRLMQGTRFSADTIPVAMLES